MNMELTDRIHIHVSCDDHVFRDAITKFADYIKGETLALNITIDNSIDTQSSFQNVKIDNFEVWVRIEKVQN